MLIGAILGGSLGFGIPHAIRSNKQRKEDEKRLWLLHIYSWLYFWSKTIEDIFQNTKIPLFQTKQRDNLLGWMLCGARVTLSDVISGTEFREFRRNRNCTETVYNCALLQSGYMIFEKLLSFLKIGCIIQLQFNRRELVLQAERKVKPSTDNLIWIMPT